MSQDKEVHVVCLEKLEEMPADRVEIEEGEEEGLFLHNQRGPQGSHHRERQAPGLRTVRCASVFDENGRFSPVFDNDDIVDIGADTILFAIGQTSDLSFLSPEDGIESDRGLIKVNPATYQTPRPTCSPAATSRTARGCSSRRRLGADRRPLDARLPAPDAHRHRRQEALGPRRATPCFRTGVRVPRINPPVIDSRRRATSIDIVEENYPDQMARLQASRCLRCNVDTVFDTSVCVACNGCVDVCPESILKLVSMRTLVDDPTWVGVAAAELGMGVEEFRAIPPDELDQYGAVMLKDETTCIRCAMCASRCPTQAVTMQRFEFERECVSIPDRNPKILYAEERV